ncbi:MAG: hypothetical protein RSA79_04085 [Oscillospiraceae bacterium]
MDKARFLSACDKIIHKDVNQNFVGTIGTLGEKTLHSVLKNYFEPSQNSQEINILNFVADIVNENGIIEIQTGNFDKLKKKLETFLLLNKVTVVFPIIHQKWIFWVDNETGELSKKRKSNKTGVPYQAFYELYKISDFLLCDNFNFCVVLIDAEEYKSLDGYGKDKKSRATKIDKIPIDIFDEIYIKNLEDYQKLLPKNLPSQFTTADLKKLTKLSPRAISSGISVMKKIGLIKQIGKNGRSFLYELI